MAISNINRYNRGPKKGQLKPKRDWVDSPWRSNLPDANGKRVDVYFPTKTAAEEYETRKKGERAKGVVIDEKAGREFIETYAWVWLASLALKPRSLNRYKSVISLHIVPFFGRMRVAEVQRIDVNRWIKEKRGKYAPATVHAMYAVLRGMMEAAVIDQRRGASPCVRITNLPARPTRGNKKRKWLPTQAQVVALAQAFTPRFRLAILIAAGCGLRFAEIMGLTEDDFDFSNRVMRVRRTLSHECDCGQACMQTTKNATSTRDVDMPASVALAAQAHIAAGYVRTLTMTDHAAAEPGKPTPVREMRLMFTTDNAKTVGRSSWHKLWTAALTAAGEILAKAPRGRYGFTTHTLRHYFGSLLIDGGASLVEVQEAMGHANPTVTLNVYTWPTSEGRALALVDKMFGNVVDLFGDRADDETDMAA